MASLLSWLGKAADDVFNANSAEDQRKRLAANQPRMYADQQRAMGNAPDPLTWFAKNVAEPANKFGYDLVTGLPRDLVERATLFSLENQQKPKSIGDFLGAITDAGVNDSGLAQAGKLFGRIAEQTNETLGQGGKSQVPFFGEQSSFSQEAKDKGYGGAAMGVGGDFLATLALAAGLKGKGTAASPRMETSNAVKLAQVRELQGRLMEGQKAQAAQEAALKSRPSANKLDVRQLNAEQQIIQAKQLAEQKIAQAQKQKLQQIEAQKQAEINKARNESDAISVRKIQSDKEVLAAKQEAQRTAGIKTERQQMIQERQAALDQANKPKPVTSPHNASAQEVVDAVAKDHANMLRDIQKSTGGVTVIREGETGAVGDRILKRYSNNDPFYRKVYKETGKPPTKAMWLEEAHRQLSKGSDEAALIYQDALKAVNPPPRPMVNDVGKGSTIRLRTPQEPGAPRNNGSLISDVPTARKLPPVGVAPVKTTPMADLSAPKITPPKGVPIKPSVKAVETPKVIPKVAPPNVPVKPAVVEQPKVARQVPMDGVRAPKAPPKVLTQEPPIPQPKGVPVKPDFSNVEVAKKPGVVAQVKNITDPVAEYGEAGKRAASKFQSKLGQLSSDLRPAKAGSAARQAVFEKMTPEEHLNFINDMQHGRPQATPELQAIADQYTKFNAQGAEVAKTIKPDFKPMKNYFTQAGVFDPKDASTLAKLWADKSNTPGSLQHRTFPSVQEAVAFAKENGIKVKETNPEKLFMNNHQQVLTSGRFNEFINEHAAQGEDPAIAQKLVERASERGWSGSPTYEAYRKAAGTVSNVQLAGGFHYGKVALEKINNDTSTFLNQVLSGHPIKAVTSGVKNIGHDLAGFGYSQGKRLANDVKNGVKTKYTDAAELANYNTAQDARYVVDGLKAKFNKTVADLTSGNPLKVGRGVVLAIPREVVGLINTGMSPLMSHFVPNVKNSAFMAQVDAADVILGKGATTAERALAYQKAANTVEGIMGQMNQDNLFWKKTMKDSLAVAMRSPGYNIGTAQQVGGGLADLAIPHPIRALKGEGSILPNSIDSLVHGKGLSTRSAYTAAMTVNAMTLGAVMTYMFTGKGPTEMKDYFFPPTGKTDKNGDAERVSIPSYTKDIFSFMHNPAQTVINKGGPLISSGIQLAQNKDYYGNMIRNPQDSIGTQAGQVGEYLKNAGQPFSIQSMNKRVDQGIAAKAESAFGVTVAPAYITQSAFQQKVQGALSAATGSKSLTPEQVALNAEKSKAKQSASGGDDALIKSLMDSGKITAKQADNLKKSSGNTSLQNQFSYLLSVDKAAAGKLIASASPADLAKLNHNDVVKSQDALAISNKGKATGQATGGNNYASTNPDITALPSGNYSVNIDGTDKTFKTQQQAQNAIAVQDFKNGDVKQKVIGNTVYSKADNEQGFTTKSKPEYDFSIEDSKLSLELDRAKDSEDLGRWSKAAEAKYGALDKLLKSYDPITEQDKIADVTLKMENLKDQAAKYSGYGGFTKPKKGRKGGGGGGASVTSAFKTAAQSQAPTISGVKVRQLAAPTFKATTKKLSVNKIPSSYLNRRLG